MPNLKKDMEVVFNKGKEGEKKEHGTYLCYSEQELDDLETAGLLPKHRKWLNGIVKYKAQDELRKSLEESDPTKAMARNLMAAVKGDPAKLAQIQKLMQDAGLA